MYTFAQLRGALLECTSYDLKTVIEEGDTYYALIDGCGDQDGDLFEDLFDVTDYITNNDQVSDYLDSLS